MSVAVAQSSSATAFYTDNCRWPAPVERRKSEADPPPAVEERSDDERPGQFDIWSAIQSQKAAGAAPDQPAAPYVHPLVMRSSSLLSQKSLEICTESLGSETGSDDFSSSLEDHDYYYPPKFEDEEEEEKRSQGVAGRGAKELSSVNFRCCRRSPPRSFPPPLPSISRRNVSCLHMRPHRLDGRLVVEAVPVPAPSKCYLHARRVEGRLVLSFADTDEPGCESDATQAPNKVTQPQQQEEVEQDADIKENEATEEKDEEFEENNCCEEEEEEEEVEVVDRGTIVEVKVSTQPQQRTGAMKVHRSSLVINKFVSGTPLSGMTKCEQPTENDENVNTVPSSSAPRRASPTATTTAAVAVAAASTLSVTTEGGIDYGHGGLWAPLGGHHPPADNKLLFTSKRRNRGELLHDMKRCSQLRRPLFIWEPCCIATSS
ncbi:hypothetical protein MUK42_15493 [Musa troglodytarum]|uniref:FAF domain-containing protein n=1 Tax=Musa troglodytarum TaxID=320322 RepID=A0A9E7HDQ4_9LILI|nr:hypothetical protein MUK42_15493 [Musa troglodytarum]